MFENWGKEELGLIIFNSVGIIIALWFLTSRLRNKLVEVEERRGIRGRSNNLKKLEEE